ncbi:MurR/RpiR family transcriptional regulator [Enterococcus sp. CSURQ0835]|uniref:MurR/RpiR family transcriptional regulator n=1 Tax=Enterococcus sp. CSURQ0835 TaxID=2681394 RepID=UPI00135AD9D6|nr:MurR/RpiR family transcriptional regulator [Enterococcus sp. CSURQ0835]
MSVISHMASMQDEMSSTETRIFQYIKQNTEKVPGMTAQEIASASAASAPTVVRFSKKMGFNSLTDLKISLSAETRQSTDTPTSYTDVTPNESFQSLKNKLSQNAQFTIHETTALFDEEIFTQAAELLERSERCFVVGIGASRLAADDAAQKWSRLGKMISFENDYNLLLPQLSNHTSQNLLWLISNSGNTPEIVALAETAYSLHIPIISLTQFGQNRLSRLADVNLQTSRPVETAIRSAATNSIIAQFTAVDLLFYYYISRNEAYAESIYRTRKAVDTFRDNYL